MEVRKWRLWKNTLKVEYLQNNFWRYTVNEQFIQLPSNLKQPKAYGESVWLESLNEEK